MNQGLKKLFLISCLLLGLMAVFILPSLTPTVRSALPPQIQITTSPKPEPSEKTSESKDFESLIKETRKHEGLFTVYENPEDSHLYLEILPEQLNRNYLCIMTLSSGIGEGWLVNGMPMGELLFQFRQVQDRIQFVVPQVNFRTTAGDPVQRSLNQGFSDSVLYALDIQSTHPERQSFLIDATDLLMGKGDLGGFSNFLLYLLDGAYTIAPEISYIKEVATFPNNVEIEVTYGFSGGGDLTYLPTVPDSRAFNLGFHYSFSELPTNNGYRPRLADERIGYFLTAYKNFSNSDRRDPFVRYINRWHLQPDQPLVFWIENTVPLAYREAVRDGILMWNEAFAQAGFPHAIEVRQMPDHPDWSPADVRYNVIRWSSSFEPSFYGLGPTRTNPLTGQILDADILIDANIIRLIKGQYQTLVRGGSTETNLSSFWQGVCGETWQKTYFRGAILPDDGVMPPAKPIPQRFPIARALLDEDFCSIGEFNRQLAIGATSLLIQDHVLPSGPEMETYVQQFIRFLVGHEVGHTLGLRHNFHGSTLLTPEELQNPEITRTVGMIGSIMDYVPPNLAPPGQPQGDYFPMKVGPYDRWAIEYGYKQIEGISPEAQLRELRQIAQRAGEPALAYGTDEDFISDLDPAVNVFDLSSNPLKYSQWQLQNAEAMWSRLNRRSPAPGESFSEMRDLFDAIFFYYFGNVMNLTLYVGGQSFNRHYAGDRLGGLPFEPIPVEEQREALAAINKYVFSEEAFQFSPQLLNQLAPSRWSHWGVFPDWFLDYPISDRLLRLQQIVLRSLLSPQRLARLQDLELKAAPQEPVLRLPELFETLHNHIWTEVITKPGTNPSSIRRALQQDYIEILSALSRRQIRVPEDAVTLAWYHLRALHHQITTTLRREGKRLDLYTRAHLEKNRDRIAKILDASLPSKSGSKSHSATP